MGLEEVILEALIRKLISFSVSLGQHDDRLSLLQDVPVEMAAHSCILNGRMQMKVNQDTRVHAFFAKESEKPTYAHKSESP